MVVDVRRAWCIYLGDYRGRCIKSSRKGSVYSNGKVRFRYPCRSWTRVRQGAAKKGRAHAEGNFPDADVGSMIAKMQQGRHTGVHRVVVVLVVV